MSMWDVNNTALAVVVKNSIARTFRTSVVQFLTGSHSILLLLLKQATTAIEYYGSRLHLPTPPTKDPKAALLCAVQALLLPKAGCPRRCTTGLGENRSLGESACFDLPWFRMGVGQIRSRHTDIDRGHRSWSWS